MRIRTTLLATGAAVLAALIAANAQVPGINSTLQSIFTLAYEVSTSKPTYSATSGAISPASSATDVCGINGSATKTIRVRRVIVTGNATTTAVTEPLVVMKRSTANVGAGAGLTKVPYSSTSAAASAAVDVWTTNPTVGTAVGMLADILVSLPVSTSPQQATVFEFGKFGSPVFLRGAAQGLFINLSGVTITGTLNCTFEWTEDNDS